MNFLREAYCSGHPMALDLNLHAREMGVLNHFLKFSIGGTMSSNKLIN